MLVYQRVPGELSQEVIWPMAIYGLWETAG